MTPLEIAENRQGELLYLSSRLCAAVFAFHQDPERFVPDKNLWWHVHLNAALVCYDPLLAVLILIEIFRGLCLSNWALPGL